MRRLRLTASGWTMALSPEIGGAILSLEHDGRPVLRPTPQAAVDAGDVLRTACYPLVPYANRIAGGRFRFDGRDYRLAPNFPGSPHTLHGVGWRRAWSVTGADEHSAELALSHAADGDWPFAFHARQHFALGQGGLSVHLSIRNTGEAPAPAGLGLHAFFPREPGQTLAFRAAGAWTNGADMLPAQRTTGAASDFVAPREPPDGLDNDLFGWAGRAILAADGRQTIIEADVRHLRLYTPAGADFLAVEPVSHMADAINRMDEPDHGLVVLAPGETFAMQARFGAPPASLQG